MSEESSSPKQEKQELPKAAEKPAADTSTPASAAEQPAQEQADSPKPAKKARASKSGKTAKKKTAPQKEGGAPENKEPSESNKSQQPQKKAAGNQRNQQGGNDSGDQGSNDSARKQSRRIRGGRGNNRQNAPEEPKVKLDTKLVAKRAWKIFLGEVNEEGLALITDKDARELAKRSLRVAEIYSREEAMQLLKEKQKSKKKKDSNVAKDTEKSEGKT